ncbi:MAG: FtsW/RodA/SpoVE family cell cycle protein [Planctomycetota bacterium]|jgi:cell division protein FtsW
MSTAALPADAAPPASAASESASAPTGPVTPWGRVAVVCALALTTLGILMVYSSSSVRAALEEGDGTFFLKRQMAWAALGLATMTVAIRVPLDAWRRHSRVLLGVVLVLLVLVLAFGPSINGSRRWFRLAGYSFQPSELAKLAVILFTAAWLCDARERLTDFKKGFLPVAGALGLTCLLVLEEPDFGTALFIGALGTALLIIGGIRMGHLMLCIVPAAPVLAYSIVSRIEVIKARFQFLGGVEETGYQVRQGLVALGSGGLFGRGVGAGTAKLYFLPEGSSDFILPVVGEEMGFLGTLLIVLLYVAYVRAGARICLTALGRDRFAFLVSLGITLWVGLQAAINIAVTTACAPTKGIALPFVSLGGSGLVMLFASTGILYAAARRVDSLPAPEVAA